VPIDPAKPPPAAPRRRLPAIPSGGGDAPASTADVVLRQRPVDARRPPPRPDSGIGTADLGVAAAAAGASRDSWHSAQFPPAGESSFTLPQVR